MQPTLNLPVFQEVPGSTRGSERVDLPLLQATKEPDHYPYSSGFHIEFIS